MEECDRVLDAGMAHFDLPSVSSQSLGAWCTTFQDTPEAPPWILTAGSLRLEASASLLPDFLPDPLLEVSGLSSHSGCLFWSFLAPCCLLA